MGAGTYHITDWIPQIVPLATKLFQHVGLRGLANVEFKLDQRDGQYKLIECNNRFNASNRLISSSGLDLAKFVYNRVVGRPIQPAQTYQVGRRLLDPLRDYCA